MKIKFVLLALFLLVALLVTSAFQTDVDWTDLGSVLAWVVSGGGAIVVALSLGALLQANWVIWQNLAGLWKNVITLAFSALLAIGASVLLNYTQIVELIQPWYQIIASVVISWLAGGIYLYGKRKGVEVGKRAAAQFRP
jgi:hypothetical protein